MTTEVKMCGSCKNGEIYDEPATSLCRVRDHENGKIVFNGYLCDDHYHMYASDGYTMELVKDLDPS